LNAWPSLLCPACSEPVRVEPEAARCGKCAAVYPLRDGVLGLVSGSRGAAAYDPHYFATLPEVEERHFWFVARRETILEQLRRWVPDLATRPLFDVGCGSGGLLSFLESQGVPLQGACDAYAEGLRIARSRCRAPLVLVDEGRKPPLGPGYSMLGLFDVLEHLDDDVGTLAWLASRLAPGGVLVLTVPAHPSLFDEMDVLARHRRRYRRGELREKLAGAGLEVRALTHFMSPLVPAILLGRGLGRLLRLGGASASARRDAELRVVPGLNALALGVLRLERRLGRFVKLPLGSSLLAVAARRGEAPGA
jgi:SAM-dependent methyltransferase